MNRERIARLISFDDNTDTSTGFVNVSDIPYLEEFAHISDLIDYLEKELFDMGLIDIEFEPQVLYGSDDEDDDNYETETGLLFTITPVDSYSDIDISVIDEQNQGNFESFVKDFKDLMGVYADKINVAGATYSKAYKDTVGYLKSVADRLSVRDNKIRLRNI